MRRKHAYVPLNTDHSYEENAHTIYSIVVGSCIGVQLLFYAGLMWWWWNGVKLVRCAEWRRRREWRHEMHADLEYTDENFLLFWYKDEQLEREQHGRQERHRSYSLSHGTPIQG